MRTAARASLVALAFLALAACNGDGARGPGTPVTKQPLPRTVVSDDGKLTIVIPPGLVDEDVEITASAVPLEQLPVELRQLRGAGAGYRLEPDGLAFDQPVEVILELERSELDEEPAGQTSAYALLSFSEGTGREILEGQSLKARLGEDSVTVSGNLTHLSFLGRTRGSLTASLASAAADQTVGEEFTAAAEATNSDSSGTVRLRAVEGTFEAVGALSFQGIDDSDADSFLSGSGTLLAFGEGLGAEGRFACQSAGFGSYGVEASAESVANVEGQEIVTPLTVVVDAVVVCAE